MGVLPLFAKGRRRHSGNNSTVNLRLTKILRGVIGLYEYKNMGALLRRTAAAVLATAMFFAFGTRAAALEPAGDESDELLPAAVDIVLEIGQASVSMLQRRIKLGYSRAARLVDQMEEKGVVGPFEGSKPRQLLITKEQWQDMQYKQNMSTAVPEEFPYEGDAVSQPYDSPPFDE